MSFFDKFRRNKAKRSEAGVFFGNEKKERKQPVEKREEKALNKASESAESLISEIKNSQTDKGFAHRIFDCALISEKSAIGEMKGKYAFAVKLSATKTEIKKAVEKVYGVKPVSVRVMNMLGKKTRFGKYFGQRKNFKKAIITLPKGSTISIHEGV